MRRKEILQPLVVSFAIALGVLGIGVWGVLGALEGILSTWSPPTWLPEWGVKAFQAGMHIAAAAATVVVWVLMFRTLFHGILGLLLEMTLERLVRIDPELPPLLPGPSLLGSLGTTLAFMGKWLLVHFLLSPLYLMGAFFPPLSLALFLWVDGSVLSREMVELVYPRLVPEEEWEHLRSEMKKGMRLWGVAVSALLLVPVVNLVVPLFAMVAMVYFVQAHRVRIERGV